MSVIILRRRKLGLSVKHMVEKSTKIDRVVRNDRPLPQNLEMVFRWGTTSNVNCNNIVNTAEAIHRVNDKAGFRKTLMDQWVQEGAGRPLCPPTWFADTWGANGPAPEVFPLVVRPRTHAQGKHVYLCHTPAEVEAATARVGAGWYASMFVDKVREYRITLAQGRVVWVAKKTPGNPEDVAWNVSRGGRFDNVRFGEWPLRGLRVAREAFLLSNLDFGAVDIMEDAEGNFFVLEINSAPSQTSPYRQECMAKAFDYIVENGKASIPVIEERGTWKKFIHPAVSAEAIMVA